MKTDRNRHAFLQDCPELVIVDEAHGAARASESGRQQRHDLVREIAARPGQGLILLTATPHSGIEQAFRSLLALLRPVFGEWDTSSLDEQQRIELARHYVQRTRRDIENQWEGGRCFPTRESSDETYPLSRAYQELFSRTYAFCEEIVTTGAASGRATTTSSLLGCSRAAGLRDVEPGRGGGGPGGTSRGRGVRPGGHRSGEGRRTVRRPGRRRSTDRSHLVRHLGSRRGRTEAVAWHRAAGRGAPPYAGRPEADRLRQTGSRPAPSGSPPHRLVPVRRDRRLRGGGPAASARSPTTTTSMSLPSPVGSATTSAGPRSGSWRPSRGACWWLPTVSARGSTSRRGSARSCTTTCRGIRIVWSSARGGSTDMVSRPES